MVVSKLTQKGQVTVPKVVREHLGVEPGDQVQFRVKPNGEVVVEPRNVDLLSLYGSVKSEIHLSLDEIDTVIKREGGRN